MTDARFLPATPGAAPEDSGSLGVAPDARPREILPMRRKTESLPVAWCGHTIVVTVGFYDDGRPGEVFGKCGIEGQQMGAIVDEAAQLISRLLQRGVTVGEIMGGIGFDHRGQPETPIGAVTVGLKKLTTPPEPEGGAPCGK